MKRNYEDNIKNISSLLEGKYKERQDILDNFESKYMSYFEILDKEIEDMEEELKKLNIDNNINNDGIIHNLEIGENYNNFSDSTINGNIINNKDIKKQCKNNIENMVYESEKYINIIKKKIKLENKHPDFNNYYVNLIMDLNRIMLKIKLFKKNYEEIEKYIISE